MVVAIAACLSTACEEDPQAIRMPDCRLNFLYEYTTGGIIPAEKMRDEYRFTSFSFVYSGEEVETDTLWFEVLTLGELSDEDRPLALEQVAEEGVENAVAGLHYVAFDDPSLQSFYRVPGHASRQRIPVVVLRKDPMLQEKSVTLKFGFKDNSVFRPGLDGLTTRTIEITDRLAKPSAWEDNYLDYTFGNYGQQKHQLMIEWTGNKWDDEYITELVAGDPKYMSFLDQKFAQRLKEENARRMADPEIGDVYRETDGTPVDLTPKSFF